MIRTLDMVCSECNQAFTPNGQLYYRDNYMNNNIRDTKFICQDCIDKWQAKWQIKAADFFEVDYVLTVDIELEDGTVYENMDCTPIDETETVVIGDDIPTEAQQALYKIYLAWDTERKAHILKDCTFREDFMMMRFSCETYGGEKFEDIAFRVTVRGDLQTEKPVPDYIKEQILDAYRLYEAQSMDDSFEE